MRELELVGLSADGRQVVFVDDTGVELAAPADDRLRAALRGDRARLGQLEIEMDSVLRPRDIQARIRAGDSPETVAALAQVDVEKIMPYCFPVLAERAHIAELARRSHVRRKGGESPSQGLADVVAERLRGRGVDPASAEWDAWRRDDGRWEVQASYLSGERQRTALFIFDLVGRYSLPDDDEAKWLTGERQATSKGPQPREGGKGGERRLSAVPTGGDLLSISDDGLDDVTDDLTAVARAVQETRDPASRSSDEDGTGETMPVETVSDELLADERLAAGPDQDERADDGPVDERLDLDGPDDLTEEPTATEPGSAETVGDTGGPVMGSGGPAEAVTEPTPQRRRRPKRASVPSWDEIMFGKDDA